MKKKINPYDRSFGAFVGGLSSGGRVSKSPKKIRYAYEGRIL